MHSADSQEIFEVFQKIIKKRKWIILASILAVLIPIMIYNETASPVYEGKTMIVFEEFNNPVDSYDYNFSRDIFFSNQLVEIKSYSFAIDIVKSLPLEIIDKFNSTDSVESEKSGFEDIVDKVQKNIAAFPVKGSNIIEISFQSSKPVVCKEVATAAANVLQKRNYEIKKEGVGGVREFIEGQMTRYKEQLDVSGTELKNFKEKNNITSVDREAEEIMRRLTDAEVLYNQVKTDIGSTKNRLAALENKLAQQKSDLVPNITNIGSSWAQKLREKLVELNLQYMNLKVQGYPEDHPKMIDLKDDMDRIQNDLMERASKIAQNESALDPLAQMEKYVGELITLQIELEALQAREEALESIMRNYNQSLGTLPDKEFELAKLTRERDVSQKIYTMLLEKLEEARIAESEQINPIRVIDKAQLPVDPISPRKKLNLAIGFLLGLIMGVAIAFVIELKNDTIKSVNEVERLTQWPVLAMIPNMNTFSRGKFKKAVYSGGDKNNGNERSYRALFSSLEPNTPIAEAYRMLRTNLQFAGLGREYKALLVTSLAPGDGKTTTITNLAITFAAFGDKTLIVDADLRIPVMHTFFGLERESGVTDLLEALGELDSIMANPRSKEVTTNETFRQDVQEKLNINVTALENNNQRREEDSDLASDGTESMQSSQALVPEESSGNHKKHIDIRGIFEKAIKTTGIQNLNFVTSGRKLQQPEGLISTRPMPLILQKFKNRFNTILVDSAPLLLVNDTLMFAGIVDAVVLVIDSNNCSKEMLLKAKKQLSNSKANVVGIVMNNFEVEGNYKKYYSSYYSEKA
jgi:tyrosine-protein kinase Etk/Wzc